MNNANLFLKRSKLPVFFKIKLNFIRKVKLIYILHSLYCDKLFNNQNSSALIPLVVIKRDLISWINIKWELRNLEKL